MRNEHNPIAQLVTQLQTKWNQEVDPYPQYQLVRWIIKGDQARLYEGMLRLESTPHGSIPDMMVVLLTPFESKTKHSASLIKDWINSYREDEASIKALQESHPEFDWDVDGFEQALSNDTDKNNSLLIDMMTAFQKALPDAGRCMTLALFPYTVSSPKEYVQWVNEMMALDWPEQLRFMVFDYEDHRYFDGVFKKFDGHTKSLSVPLDLQGAIEKIATAGDPNKPDVQFRKCMMQMSKATNKEDLEALNKWGGKGLEVTQRSGVKSLFITAHLVYAGMLFNFKEFELVDDLLLRANQLTKQALEREDDTCKPLMIQVYGLQASSKQLQKKREEAANLFCKQADAALQYGFPQQPLNAWWMAYSAVRKRDKDLYKELVVKAYEYGAKQEKEVLQSTCMPFVALDYYQILEAQGQREGCERIDAFMTDVEGKDWMASLEIRKKEMEKRKLSFKNWF